MYFNKSLGNSKDLFCHKMQNQQSLTEDSNILSFKSTYSVRQPKTIFLQCAQPLADSLPVSSLFYPSQFTPFPVNHPLPLSFSFPFTFPPGIHPHTPPPPPPPLSSYLNCKLQQCRLPEELLNVIRADPVD